MKLIKPSNKILWQVAERVTDIDKHVKPHLNGMKTILLKKNGLGLAAPQVGIPYRFFIMVGEYGKIECFINPSYDIPTWSTEFLVHEEGCLTWPGQHVPVGRHNEICVSWTTIDDIASFASFSGLPSRIVQHECDHLDGKCIFKQP